MKRFAALFFVVVLGVSFSGCSSESSQSTESGFMTWSEVVLEYRDAAASFPYELPAGVSFPFKMMEKEPGTQYQKGSGVVQAWSFWECAQQDRFLDNLGVNDAEATAALDALEEGTKSPRYQQYFNDPEGVFFTEVIGKSRLGDSSIMREFYEADCGWYRENTGQ